MAIQTMDFAGQIPFFLQQYLSRPASALPKSALWVIDFEGIDYLQQTLVTVSENEPAPWDISAGLEVLVTDSEYKRKGCLFAQAVVVPGESFVANPEGIQQQNFIRSVVGSGRDMNSTLLVTFLETNVSFVDNFIRPWILATARYGMKARSGSKRYRVNATFYRLGVREYDSPPIVQQKYTFYGLCPTNLNTEEYNYGVTTSPINREVSFTFHTYSLATPTEATIDNYDPTTRGGSLPIADGLQFHATNIVP